MKKSFYRLIFDRRRGLRIFIFSALTLLAPILAKSLSQESSSEMMIEMELKADPYSSYKQKRTDWSKRISIGLENFMPEKYISPIDQSKYSELVGSNSLQIANLNIGTQYNTKMGALFLDLFYAIGATSGTANGVTTTIGASKYGGSTGLFLDTLFENPYLSPYISYQFFSMDWKEVAPVMAVNTGGNISFMSSYQVGLSIHLDKLDPQSAGDAYAEYGLKNSFLDLFGTQTMKSPNRADPDMSTAFNWGMNFRLEF